MSNRRNDSGGRVVGFKDGAPVYKKVNRGAGRTPARAGAGKSTGRSSDSPRREGEKQGFRPKRDGVRSEPYRRDDKSERGERNGERFRRDFERPRAEGGERSYNNRRNSSVREGIARHEEEVRRIRTERKVGRTYENLKPLPKDLPLESDAGAANETAETELPNIIMGRNPVKEAIKSGRSIDRILVTKEHDGSLNEILDLAYEAKLVVRDVDRSKLDEICMPFGHNGRTGNHQGIIAYIPGVEYCELSDILDCARERGEAPFVILLDGIEDPHNLGSIIRSAECAGAHGVVITKRRSASVTAAVIKTSAGATEHMKIAKVVNLGAAIDQLKEAGVWVAGADMGGETMYKADLKGAFALAVGAEGAGLSRLVKEKCDFIISVPLKGEMESLNASVAAAIIMFEKVRQEQC